MSEAIKTDKGADTREIINQREDTYGGFENNAHIHHKLMAVITLGNNNLPSVQASAMMHITGKLARAVSGDINYIDNWQDIAGYAQLVVDHLKKQQVQGELVLDEAVTFDGNEEHMLKTPSKDEFYKRRG